MENRIFVKDPDTTLDYTIDYSNHFSDGDMIINVEIIAPSEIIIVGDPVVTNNKVIIWLSGGVIGNRYNITCRTTSQFGRIEDYSFDLIIKQR